MPRNRTTTATLTTALTLTALATSALTAHADSSDPWVRSWGSNTGSQLGNGNTVQQLTPANVLGIARQDVQELGAGGAEGTGSGTTATPGTAFAVALLKDGTVMSWGSNTSGQIGNGTTTAQAAPAAVAGLSGISHVAAGLNHALAVRNGRVLSWGSNTSGQLGNGVAGADPGGVQRTPVPVQSLDRVVDVGAGCDFSVALRDNGTVWAWGSAADGRLGNDDDKTNSSTPKQVKALTDVVGISVGCGHVLALAADGTVKAWGKNSDGQLGNDSRAQSAVPVTVQYLDSVAKVAATTNGSFAILDDGSLKAWGDNNSGQLGDGYTDDRTTAVPIDAVQGVKEIAGGPDHTIAALDNGSVVAWGANANGQLGNGSLVSSAAPTVSLPAGSDISHVSAATNGRSSFAY
ncbi:chromosome condensation regulator RCC1 [Streptomyces sp. NPDC089915]|uniref:RCC1 domain-containing protein n=1 Tax=Streptomyces sp. NPDC089915 TaxID=3155186 RepID=UPI00341812A4